jgi:hypothetical protein
MHPKETQVKLTGYGALFIVNKGNILHVFVGSSREDTTNGEEIWDPLQGIKIADKMNISKIIVEGDSTIILGV